MSLYPSAPACHSTGRVSLDIRASGTMPLQETLRRLQLDVLRVVAHSVSHQGVSADAAGGTIDYIQVRGLWKAPLLSQTRPVPQATSAYE